MWHLLQVCASQGEGSFICASSVFFFFLLKVFSLTWFNGLRTEGVTTVQAALLLRLTWTSWQRGRTPINSSYSSFLNMLINLQKHVEPCGVFYPLYPNLLSFPEFYFVFIFTNLFKIKVIKLNEKCYPPGSVYSR